MFRGFVIFAIYFYTTYKFLQHFGKGEFDDALAILRKYKSVDCPASYTLHRLQYNKTFYLIQSEAWKYSSEPGTGSEFKFRRCQIFPKHAHGLPHFMFENNTTDLREEENVILEKACSKTNYSNSEFHGPAIFNKTEPSVLKRFLSYWFEIVKGPIPDLPEPKSETEEWNIRTLLGGIFPGTLWCGFGNIADDIYNNLGELQETDSCCRAHDLCKPKIRAFQTRYYYNNPSIIPVSHCSCDIEFYKCLKRVNSPASNRIGNIYYNLVKIKCFDFDVREVCVREFLGFCLKTGKRCVAILKNSIEY